MVRLDQGSANFSKNLREPRFRLILAQTRQGACGVIIRFTRIIVRIVNKETSRFRTASDGRFIAARSNLRPNLKNTLVNGAP
jgi:hypothetical protein